MALFLSSLSRKTRFGQWSQRERPLAKNLSRALSQLTIIEWLSHFAIFSFSLPQFNFLAFWASLKQSRMDSYVVRTVPSTPKSTKTLEPSTSSSSKKRSHGPQRSAAIWEYFREETETTLTDENNPVQTAVYMCNHCDSKYQNRHTTNFRSHLRIHHALEYNKLLSTEAGKKQKLNLVSEEAETMKNFVTHSEVKVPANPSYYTKSGPKHKSLMGHLTPQCH